MKKLNQTELLDLRIAELTLQHNQELVELKQQFHAVKNSMSPTNIVQQGLNGFYQTFVNKENLMSTILSIIGGYVSKKVVIGKSDSSIKKIIGNVLQFFVTSYLTKKNTKTQTE